MTACAKRKEATVYLRGPTIARIIRVNQAVDVRSESYLKQHFARARSASMRRRATIIIFGFKNGCPPVNCATQHVLPALQAIERNKLQRTVYIIYGERKGDEKSRNLHVIDSSATQSIHLTFNQSRLCRTRECYALSISTSGHFVRAYYKLQVSIQPSMPDIHAFRISIACYLFVDQITHTYMCTVYICMYVCRHVCTYSHVVHTYICMYAASNTYIHT
jgi:hypothetical protein